MVYEQSDYNQPSVWKRGQGAGGKLAKKLGIPFYDKELIAMIAKEGNIEPSILEANEEVEPDLTTTPSRSD